MTTLSLFPELDGPVHTGPLRTLFVEWVAMRRQVATRARAERAFSEASITVYEDMWHAFVNYCYATQRDFATLHSADLEAFLRARGTGRVPAIPDTPELSLRYCWRLLKLIDRLAQFHADQTGTVRNVAARDLLDSPMYRYANAAQRDPSPLFYEPPAVARLIGFISQSQHSGQGGTAHVWKDARDRATIAVMLGGGLTPGDVRVLELHGVLRRTEPAPWELALPANGNGPARQTPLMPWAAQLLAEWLALRTRFGLAGTFVFPATAAGKPWSHTACHVACKTVLAAAGFSDAEQGIFKLRHTFALHHLAQGQPENTVAQWLGLLDIHSMTRYRLPATLAQ